MFAILLFIPCFVKSQIDYPIFKTKNDFNIADSGKLSFRLDNINYGYNTEYFGNIPLSGTWLGYQLVPELQYQPTKRFQLRAGLYLQKEFGRTEYTTVAPTFTAKVFLKHSTFLIGTLDGNLSHNYIEPLYDYKLYFTQRIEDGLQYLVHTKYYSHDFFLNWRRAIHVGDPFREELDLGYTAHITLYNNNKIQIGIPIQAIQTHKGGQISVSTDHLQTLMDIATGISAGFDLNNFLKRIEIENFYVGYKALSGGQYLPYDKGNGYLAHVLFKFEPSLDLDLRYWSGNGFINPRGGPLFQSVSEKIPGLTERYRNLFFVSGIYDKEIFKKVNVDLRFTPYYDFGEKILEYSYEVYLRYSTNIFLKKIKN